MLSIELNLQKRNSDLAKDLASAVILIEHLNTAVSEKDCLVKTLKANIIELKSLVDSLQRKAESDKNDYDKLYTEYTKLSENYKLQLSYRFGSHSEKFSNTNQAENSENSNDESSKSTETESSEVNTTVVESSEANTVVSETESSEGKATEAESSEANTAETESSETNTSENQTTESEAASEASENNANNEETITVKSYTRRKSNKKTDKTSERKEFGSDLEKRYIIADIPEDDKKCACKHELSLIGYDKTERLQVIPAQAYVEVILRPIYACRYCEGSGDEDKPVFRQVLSPKNLLLRSKVTDNFLAYIFYLKFFLHMPFYRQEHYLFHVSRAKMVYWMIKVHKKLAPLERIMLEEVKKGKLLNMDETTLRVIRYEDPEKNENRKKSYIWVCTGGEGENKLVIYRYNDTRSASMVNTFIDDFGGWIQTDQFPGYDSAVTEHNKIKTNKNIVSICCLAHIRRGFFESKNVLSKDDTIGNSLAEKALSYIANIYSEENKLQNLGLKDDKLILKRKENILPILNEFHDWLIEIQPTVVPSLKLGRAISYALGAFDKLLNYIDCPDAYVDNMISENAIRPIAVGRKNWLFNMSEEGARASCFMYSLIESAVIHNLNPYDYLRSVFEQAALSDDTWNDEDWKDLLPYYIDINPLELQKGELSNPLEKKKNVV